MSLHCPFEDCHPNTSTNERFAGPSTTDNPESSGSQSKPDRWMGTSGTERKEGGDLSMTPALVQAHRTKGERGEPACRSVGRAQIILSPKIPTTPEHRGGR